MNFGDKLEILIARRGLKKTQFADEIGVTYRALANYLSGFRMPKPGILRRIAEELGVAAEFLTDDKQMPVLDSKERFVFNANSDERFVNAGVGIIENMTAFIHQKRVSDEDKRALWGVLCELYFDAMNNQENSREER